MNDGGGVWRSIKCSRAHSCTVIMCAWRVFSTRLRVMFNIVIIIITIILRRKFCVSYDFKLIFEFSATVVKKAIALFLKQIVFFCSGPISVVFEPQFELVVLRRVRDLYNIHYKIYSLPLKFSDKKVKKSIELLIYLLGFWAILYSILTMCVLYAYVVCTLYNKQN